MFKNFLKIALRNLKVRKSFSIINISGLAIGMACFILMLLWVEDELSYDRFHENYNQIYRISLSGEVNNKRVQVAYAPRPLGKALIENVPGIVNYSTFFKIPTEVLVGRNDIKSFEKNVAGADPGFFKIFSFSFIAGSPETALQQPYSVVLTKDMAQKYFGNEDPIQQNINIAGVLHKVTGVIENVPLQSHIQFDCIVSHELIEKYLNNAWVSINCPYYLHIQKNADTQEIIQQMNALVQKHTPKAVEQMKMIFSLQPLADIHLNTNYIYEYSSITDGRIVNIIVSVAILILLIACANFMNLSTALATSRIKEISLRKVVGSRKSQLIIQFLGECLIYTALAFGIAIIIVELLLPVFNHFFDKSVSIDFFTKSHSLTAIGLIFITGIFAGSYPAFFLASFTPIQAIRGNIFWAGSKNIFRKILVIAQFAISIGLIICTMLIKQQFSLLLNKDLGFDKENILYVQVKGTAAKNYANIKNDLLLKPKISNVSVCDHLPTDSPNQTPDVNWQGREKGSYILVEPHEVGYDYFATLNLQLSAGRYFSREFETDAKGAYILNEEAVKEMELKSPLGKPFSLYKNYGKIVGVVKNANFRSLKQHKITPQVFYVLNNLERNSRPVVLIKIKGNEFHDISKTIAGIEQVFQKYNPDYPFEYHFLDDDIENFYVDIKRLSQISNYFTLLAIIIACLGLFGLSSFSIQKRTKEIGVRKVVGASTPVILSILVKDFTKWILLANIIAWPIAWYAMNQWLQNFAYRIEISWWMFFLAGGIALAIALLTVSWQAIRAAMANPVESLRYE